MSSSYLAAAALRRQESEGAPTSEQVLGHPDVSGLVLEHLSLPELSALADAQPTLLPRISALEEKWLRGCVALCGGTLDWLKTYKHPLDKEGTLLAAAAADSWMATWRTLAALRAEFLACTVPKLNDGLHLPETLPWGDEEWTRRYDLPLEAEMRDAFARCALYHPSLVEGCGDPQCDTYPVGVAFYRRTALSDLGAMDAGAIEEAIVRMRGAFFPECSEDYVNDAEEAVLAPISVSALLANCPSPVYSPVYSPMGGRRLERAVFEAATSCAAFVALCVGEAPALKPAQALEALHGTCEVIVGKGCKGCGDSDWEIPAMGEHGEYDDDPEVTHGGDWEYISTLGIDQVEHALKAQLAAVATRHGVAHAGLAAATAADAALGLQWDDGMVGVATVKDAANMALAAHKEELAKLIDVQMRAVAGDDALDVPMVRPVMLTSSDANTRYWSGARDGDNDHEGVQALAFVSETWALVVAGKCPSC